MHITGSMKAANQSVGLKSQKKQQTKN